MTSEIEKQLFEKYKFPKEVKKELKILIRAWKSINFTDMQIKKELKDYDIDL